MVTVQELMQSDLACLEPDLTATQAATLMRERRIGSIFVKQDGQIVGIVTEADLVHKVVGAGHDPRTVAIKDIMSSPVVGIDVRRPITEAADLMERYRTRHLAVTRTGAIVGVVSVRDLLRPVSVDEF